MATEAQVNANRANARKSTGPRTPEGKAVASQNAVTHGFLAQETVIQGEDTGEFALYRERMVRDLAPVGDGELDMAERIVGLAWRLRRAERLQTETFNTLYEKMAAGAAGVPEQAPGAAEGANDRILGRMLVEDFSHDRILEKLSLYERRIETSMYRTMRELREQKRLRLAVMAEAVGGRSARGFRGTGVSSASLLGQGLPGGRDHGQDAHATAAPGGVAASRLGSQGSLFKTKPISEEVSSLKCELSSGQGEASGPPSSNFAPETAALPPLCETNPISRDDSSVTPAVRRVA